MQGLHLLDLTGLVVYLVGITALGIWVSRRVKNASDFFMPRRFGSGMMIMHAFGTGTASDQAVSVASATFKGGLSGIWYQWLWLFATPFYWLIAPIFRRFRAVTTADVYELRFNRSVAVLFSLVGIANMCVKIGLMLKGAGVLIDASTAGLVNTELAIVVVTLMFVIYGAAGGLSAAIFTDYAQGLMTILFSFMLLPSILSAVGGMAGVKQTIADPHMLSLVAPGKVTLFFVIMMSLQALVGIVAQPFIMGVCAAGKTEWEGRVGIVVGNLIKRICTIAWALTAIAAVAWYLQQGIDLASVDPDSVYGNVAQEFLPRMGPGLLGIFLAALLAGVMSSCDSFMISSAALFTENIYRHLRPQRTGTHYLWVGRAVSLLVVLGGVAFAFWVPNVVKALEIWFMIAPMMGLAFWLGLLWRPMNSVGAWATTLTGFASWWLTSQGWFVRWAAQWPLARDWGMIWHDPQQGDSITIPWQILGYMFASVMVGMIFSLLTKPTPLERLDRFYQLTRTPVRKGETIEAPCTLPTGVPPSRREMLTTALGLEIPRPSWASLIGFCLAWLAVAVLIGGFLAFVQ